MDQLSLYSTIIISHHLYKNDFIIEGSIIREFPLLLKSASQFVPIHPPLPRPHTYFAISWVQVYRHWRPVEYRPLGGQEMHLTMLTPPEGAAQDSYVVGPQYKKKWLVPEGAAMICVQ